MQRLPTNRRIIVPTEASLKAPDIHMTPCRVGMSPSSSHACISTPPFASHRPSVRNTTDPACLSAQHSPGVLEYVPAPHAMQLAELGAPAAECFSVQRVCCSPDTCTLASKITYMEQRAHDSDAASYLIPTQILATTRRHNAQLGTCLHPPSVLE
jgi:hypothetical protein